MHVGYEKLTFSTNISLYLGNNTRGVTRIGRNSYAVYRIVPCAMSLSDF